MMRACTDIWSLAQAARIALAVHALVVPARIFGHVGQVLGPGQRFEHPDRHHDMVVDDLALGLGQGAELDGQVGHFVGVEEVASRRRRCRSSGSARSRRTRSWSAAACPRRRRWRARRKSRSPVELPPVRAASAHRSAALRIAAAARISRSARGSRRRASALRSAYRSCGCDRRSSRSLVALSTTCTGVVILPQSCSRPAIHSSLRSLSVIRKSASGPVVGRVHRLGQHHRQFGHKLAVAARIGRLFIDADVDQVDERFEQIFELHDQLLVGDGDRRLRRQRLDEALVGRRKGAISPVAGIDAH